MTTLNFSRSYSAAPAVYSGGYRDYYKDWRGDSSQRSQSRGRSQWRTYNKDWDTWGKGYYYSSYGSGDRSPSRGRYGSWGRYGDRSGDWYDYNDYSKGGYWVGNWWYCGDGDWYWSRDTGYTEWKKEEENKEEGEGEDNYYDDYYYKTSDYWECTPETPKNDWGQEQWATLEDRNRQNSWWNNNEWNTRYYYYDDGKDAADNEGQWENRVDYGWHLSSKFPRAPKTLEEHYEPNEDAAATPGNPHSPCRASEAAEFSWNPPQPLPLSPSPSPPLAEPLVQEQTSAVIAAENTVWRLTLGGGGDGGPPTASHSDGLQMLEGGTAPVESTESMAIRRTNSGNEEVDRSEEVGC
ncbi:hypothetical protein FOZ61_006164 [Perkinsus olseni]|uniref:Uncharacterized protein n=1 Tax=Perkinsus olseni TaxID=32597 RepID=A0A7J6L8X4_PEROL|nr:hypothetical protein FOL46_008202 [Perkinsus olseni]KAF4657589.1 hypothetical protein FOZ61_006164 [Perkinsus olseni]